MQLFLIHDFKYNIVFLLLYAITSMTQKSFPIEETLIPSFMSFFPAGVILSFTFEGYLWILGFIYSIAITILPFLGKKLAIEENYLNTLFDDFNKYLNNLNLEYNKNIKLKELKEKKIY